MNSLDLKNNNQLTSFQMGIMGNDNIHSTVEKIDVEDLIKDFKILNIDSFYAYLKELWKVI
jgi:hypothetical protein